MFERTWVHDYLIIILTLSLLYALFLGVRPLTPPDEARYSEIPREMVVNHDYITPTLNGIKYFEKPALFYWLQSLSIKFLGLNEWSLRLVNALMGILGCVLTYWGTRRLYDRKTGLLASFILASSLLYAGMSQFVTLDMTVTALLTGGLISFILGIKNTAIKRRNLMWMMYAFFALATLTKGLIGIIIPGLVLFTWFLICNEWQQLKKCHLLSGSIIFLAITLPWHIMVQLKNPEFFHFYFIEQHFLRYLTDYAHRQQAIWFLPAVLLLGFFPWIVFLFPALKFNLPSWKQRKERGTEVFLLLWAALVFLFYWKSHSQLAPYILPVFPPLAIMTSRYLNHYWSEKNGSGPRLGFILLLIISVFLLIGSQVYFYIHPDKIALIASHHLVLGLAISSLSFFAALICNFRGILYQGIPFVIFGGSCLITAINFNLLDERSVKPLAEKLNAVASVSDQVVSYHTYYQDLPFYLQKGVILLNFKGELEFGMKHQDIKQIVINENDLWKLWDTKQRVFMILKQQDYNSLLKDKKITRNSVIARTRRNLLISNQENKP